MKHVTKALCFAAWFFSIPAHALNVVEGWYAGMILGANYSPDVTFDYLFDFTYNPDVVGTQYGKLTYSAFGNIGGLLGYRFPSGFRLELEADYSYVPYEKIAFGVFNTEEPYDTRIITIRSPNHSTGIKMEGSTSSGLVFVNAFYEYIQNGCEYNWAPYIGFGIGYGYINNSAKLFDNEVDVDFGNVSVNTSTPIAQAIIGISYFLDDFTAFALDARYITTAKKIGYATPTYPDIPTEYTTANRNLEILTQSILFTSRYQIYTVNLTFTGAFNCL